MDRLIERVAGLDVHKASVKACVRVPAERPGERHSQTPTFRTTTAGLVLLRDWLASHQVTVVGMESTGVLLEAGLGPAGGRVPVLAAECPASAQRARPQDRCGRCGLDLPAGRARAGPPELRAAQAASASCAQVPQEFSHVIKEARKETIEENELKPILLLWLHLTPTPAPS